MSKKVLAVYYSQSGQLGDIVDNFCDPLIAAGISVEKVHITLQEDHVLPWTASGFFSVMPDCVLGVPAPINEFTLKESAYDLVVLGYQAWFLSPSIPFNSFMHHPLIQQVLINTPVITMTGARNMWVSAYKGVKKILKDRQARPVGTIALVDRHPNLISFVTIFHWMLHNRKDRYLSIFPRPGVSDKDIANMQLFGTVVIPYLQNNDWTGLQDELLDKKAVDLKYHLMFIESKASVMFKAWAKLISKKKKKGPWLSAFKYYLLFALFIAAPIVYLLDLVIFKPLLSKYISNQKASLLKLS